MIKSILSAVDGSPSSVAGMKQAVAWAKRLGAEVRVAFVEDEQRFVYYPAVSSFEGGMAVPVTLPEEDLAKVTEEVRAEVSELRKLYEAEVQAAGVTGEFLSPRGNVNDLLVAEARMADLVVMGRRGKSDPAGSTKAGPTTETLIHDAVRPVLVVPEAGRMSGPVVFAFDGSVGINRVLIHGAVLTASLKTKAVVVTVDDNAERGAALQNMALRYLKPHGIEADYVVRKGRPANTIAQVAEERQAGLVVMGAFGRSPIRELFFGSTTLDVLEQVNCPVLLMA